MRVKKPLGEVLVQSGLLTSTDLTKALEVQQVSGHRLGEVFVALGYLTQSDVALAMAEQLGIPFIPDHGLKIDLQFVNRIQPSVARRTNTLPLWEEDGTLILAMSDPLDVFSMDEIRHLTGLQIKPVACSRTGLLNAITQYERLAALGQTEATGSADPTATDWALPDAVDETPIVQLVNDLINRALSERASDIHVEPSDEKLFRVRIRVDGMLHEIITPPMAYHPAVVARIKVMAGMDISERRTPQDGRIELRERNRKVDIRVNSLPTVFGEKLVLRIFDKSRSLPKLAEIGFSPEVLESYSASVRKPTGMLLVTGPTGSGKTTTLISTLAFLNSPAKNIVTIEDPVEYQLLGINHVQVSAKSGLSFADGLRAILRQDPNIVMVGEIRDGETANVAVRAALTGHLVLSTLHTNDAAGALTRLLNMGLEPYLITSAVLGVMAQRLVRRLCEHCKQPYELPADSFAAYGVHSKSKGPLIIYRAGECENCRGTGYSGRFPIFEFLRMSPAVEQLVLQRQPVAAARRQAAAEGMKFLVANGLEKALEGLTTAEEVFRVASTDSPGSD